MGRRELVRLVEFRKIQNYITCTIKYTVNWQLRIQPTKSEQITFCRRSTNKSSQYTINGVLIPQASSVKDLGVTISSDLKWHNYVSKICAKSISLAYLILKSFHSKDPFFFSNLFKLYIRPNLEYNVSVWNPYHIGGIKKVESVQATFTRIDKIDKIILLFGTNRKFPRSSVIQPTTVFLQHNISIKHKYQTKKFQQTHPYMK